MSELCICLEKIGDNGPCPVHGNGYQAGTASLFASIARVDTRFDEVEVELHPEEGDPNEQR